MQINIMPSPLRCICSGAGEKGGRYAHDGQKRSTEKLGINGLGEEETVYDTLPKPQATAQMTTPRRRYYHLERGV